MRIIIQLTFTFSFIGVFRLSLAEVTLQDDPSLWPGHLEPLAAKSKKTSVETLDTFPSPEVFFKEYVLKSKPVAILGGAKLSQAFSLWSDDYFLGLPGAEKLVITAESGKKENRTNPAKEITFKQFVETYRTDDIYMVNGVPQFLQKDVLLPPPLLCEDLKKNLVDTVIWFSSGGTKSVVHNDDVDNINCLFSGTKELLFMDYKKYKGKVTIDHPEGGYSGVDVDRVDFTKYPGLREVEYFNVTMRPGDCLFIPYKWFHQVRSFDRNIAVNVWFQHKKKFVPKQCNLEPGQTLDKFYFASLSQNGDDQGPVDLFLHFASLITGPDHKLNFDEFEAKMKTDEVMMGRGKYTWNEQFTKSAKSIFTILDENKDGKLNVKDFHKLSGSAEVTEVLEKEAATIEDLLEDQQESSSQTNDDDSSESEQKRDEL